jgi:hypothetical protein
MKKIKQLLAVILEWLADHIGDVIGTIFMIACMTFLLFMFRGCANYVEKQEKQRASFSYEIHVLGDNYYYTDEYTFGSNNIITFYDGMKSNTVVIANQKVTIKNQHPKK